MIFENNLKLKKVVTGILLVVIAILIITLLSPFVKTDKAIKVENKPQAVLNHVPIQTNYKDTLPPLFPTTIPIRKLDKLAQSYSMDYGSLKQSSIVLFSKDDMSTAVAFYKDAFTGDGYVIATTTRLQSSIVVVANKVGSRIEVTFIDRSKNQKKHDEDNRMIDIKTHIVMNIFAK